MNYFRLFKKNVDFQNYFYFVYFVVIIFFIFNINYKINSIPISYEQGKKDYQKQEGDCLEEAKKRSTKESLNNFFNFPQIQQIFKDKSIEQILSSKDNYLEDALFRDFINNKIIPNAKQFTKNKISSLEDQISSLEKSGSLVDDNQVQKDLLNEQEKLQNLQNNQQLEEHLKNILGEEYIRKEYFRFILNSYKDENPLDNSRNLQNLKRTQMFSHFKAPTNLQFKIEYLHICYKKLEELTDLFSILNFNISNFQKNLYDKIFKLRDVQRQDVDEAISFFKYLGVGEKETEKLFEEFENSNLSNKKIENSNLPNQSPKEDKIQSFISKQMEELISQRIEELNNNKPNPFVLDSETKKFLKEDIWKKLDVYRQKNKNTLEKIKFEENEKMPDLHKKEFINSIVLEINELNKGFRYQLELFNSNLKLLNNKFYLIIFQTSCLLDNDGTEIILAENQFIHFLKQKNKLLEIIFKFFIEKIDSKYKSIMNDFSNYKQKYLDKELELQIQDIENSYALIKDLSYIFLDDPEELKKQLTKDLETIKVQTPKIIDFLYYNDFSENIKKETIKDNILKQLQKNEHIKLSSCKSSFKKFIDDYLEKFFSLKVEYQTKKKDLEDYDEYFNEKEKKYLIQIESNLDSLFKQILEQILKNPNKEEKKCQEQNFEISLHNVEWIKQFISSYKDSLSNKFRSFKIENDIDHQLWDNALEEINKGISQKFEDNKKPENIHKYNFDPINKFIQEKGKEISQNKNLDALRKKHENIDSNKKELDKFCAQITRFHPLTNEEKQQSNEEVLDICKKIEELLEKIKQQSEEEREKSSIENQKETAQNQKTQLEEQIEALEKEKTIQDAEYNKKSEEATTAQNQKTQLEKDIEAKLEQKTNIENEKIPKLETELAESKKRLKDHMKFYKTQQESFTDELLKSQYFIDFSTILNKINQFSSVSEEESLSS